MSIGSFGELGAFVHTAETRSFTEAGRRLGLSSSAIGKAVSRLEDELGVRLFHRSTRAITLTAEGELFLERCQRIMTEFEIAQAELTQANLSPQGKLRVGLPQLGMYWLPYLNDFQHQFPDIELELSFTDRLVSVIDEGFDAVIRIGEIEDSRLMMRRLIKYRHLLVASPDYLAKQGMPQHPDDLLSHACLRYRYPTSGKLAPWSLLINNELIAFDPPVSAISDITQALQIMAESNLGIALLPDFSVQNAIASGRLVSVLEEYVLDNQTVSILWPSGRQALPKIKVFVDFMTKQFSA